MLRAQASPKSKKRRRDEDEFKLIDVVLANRKELFQQLLASDSIFKELIVLPEFLDAIQRSDVPLLANKLMAALIELFEVMGETECGLPSRSDEEYSNSVETVEEFIKLFRQFMLDLKNIPQEKMDDFLRMMMAKLFVLNDVYHFGYENDKDGINKIEKLLNAHPKQSFGIAIVRHFYELGTTNTSSLTFDQLMEHVNYMP